MDEEHCPYAFDYCPDCPYYDDCTYYPSDSKEELDSYLEGLIDTFLGIAHTPSDMIERRMN